MGLGSWPSAQAGGLGLGELSWGLKGIHSCTCGASFFDSDGFWGGQLGRLQKLLFGLSSCPQANGSFFTICHVNFPVHTPSLQAADGLDTRDFFHLP